MRPAANRFVEEKDKDRRYKQHVRAIAKMKPSLDTRQQAVKKFTLSARKNPNLRVFDGEKAVRNEKRREPNRHRSRKSESESEILSLASETSNISVGELDQCNPPHVSFEWRPKTAVPGPRPAKVEVIRRPSEKCGSHQSIPQQEEVFRREAKTGQFEFDGMKVKYGLDMWDTSDEETDCFELLE
jgi:hypothetical protein